MWHRAARRNTPNMREAMQITSLDILLIVIGLLSAGFAMYRGFVREVLSIVAWTTAAVTAWYFFPALLPHLTPYIASPLLSQAVSALVIFLVTLTVVSYITVRIADFVSESRMGALDRSLGFVFGLARGVLLMVIALLVFGWFVPDERQPEWIASAKSKPLLQLLGDHFVALLPENPQRVILGDTDLEAGGVPGTDTISPDLVNRADALASLIDVISPQEGTIPGTVSTLADLAVNAATGSAHTGRAAHTDGAATGGAAHINEAGK